MKNKSNVFIITLGCSKNIYDSETIISILNANNYNICFDFKKADIVIINTCGFINPAKEESIQVISDCCEMKKKHTIKQLIVCGCLSQRYKDDLIKAFPEVDKFFGVYNSKEISQYLSNTNIDEFNNRMLITPEHYAYIKIADGCNHACSFCAIPLIKGKYQSRSIEDIVDEIKNLSENGVKEFNIIAQDTTYYGVDIYDKQNITELFSKIAEIESVEWIRMLYAYPTTLNRDIINFIAQNNKCCKYFDIPLQHISTKILTAMKRGIDDKKTIEVIENLKSAIPDCAIRSSFIVGFPGESDKDFNQLYKFINDYELDRVGIFTFSPEDNTPAYDLKNSVPESVMLERRNELMLLQQKISLKKNKNKIGSTLKIIIDDEIDKTHIKYAAGYRFYGRTQFDAPDVDNGVYIKTKKKELQGSFIDLKISSAEEYDLFGEY